MTYAELLQLYFQRSDSLQWLWTLYVVIAGGLLAFSSVRQRPDFITGILVTVLFAFFAYKNLGGIGDITDQRFATLDALHQYASAGIGLGKAADIVNTLNPPTWESVRNFHITSDIMVIITIWAMELRRIKSARAASKP